MRQTRILIVERDEAKATLLARGLALTGHATATAASFSIARERVEREVFDAVLAGIDDGDEGVAFVEWTSAARPGLAVVAVSARGDARQAVRAMRGGAMDVVLEPFEFGDLTETLARAADRKAADALRRRYVEELEKAHEWQGVVLRDIQNQLRESSEDTLEALAAALDARERETRAHSKRVSEYSVHLAAILGVAGEELEAIRKGALLHDIGKIGIPDSILLKPDELTPEEWVVMRKHPEIGAWIVGGVESLKPSVGIVMAHHERFDGGGYPRGLRGREIPLGARVFAIADTLDAMLSDRPYRRGQPFEDVRTEIRRNANSQFDPAIAECFLEIAPDDWTAIRHGAASPHGESRV